MSSELYQLYEYLAHKHQLLLPDSAFCTLDFLQSIESGFKKAVPLDKARDFYLPVVSFAPTTTEDLYRHCILQSVLKPYMPESKVPNREFLIKIMATFELETLLKMTKLILMIQYKCLDIPIKEPDKKEETSGKQNVDSDVDENELDNILDNME